jgi:hypothetical protein
MICPQCNAENPAGGKFCGDCGSALETACTRCGNLTRPNDHFCSSCGQALGAEASADTTLPAQKTTRQYTPQEIEELLILRRLTRREETASKTLNQDDVDKLFG